jgi:acetyl-CoA acetyltransferase
VSERRWSPEATAIAGIGATEFSKASGRSELRLALEAIQAAVLDAGLELRDIDGLCTYTMDVTPPSDILQNLGLPALRFFSRSDFGGGAAGAVIQQAAIAVATGMADVVVAYRALNERSGYRFGTGDRAVAAAPNAESIRQSWYVPHGLSTPAARVALFARRYMHEYGATSEDFGQVSVTARAFAATNPNAWFYGKPLTLAEHQASRMIADPLRLYDCCQESDGGVAIVITSLDRAKDLKQKPVKIVGACQSIPYNVEVISNYYHADLSMMPEAEGTAKRLYAQTGMKPTDMQAAMIYDAFTPQVLKQLEGFGFCKRGEAKDFIKSGEIDIDGILPINTNGGLIGEAYIHGMNNIAEGVRQVRGTAVNQVKKVERVLVSSGMAGAIFEKV